MTQNEHCACEKDSCNECYTMEQYNTALKIYETYTKRYGNVVNSPYSSWLREKLEQRNAANVGKMEAIMEFEQLISEMDVILNATEDFDKRELIGQIDEWRKRLVSTLHNSDYVVPATPSPKLPSQESIWVEKFISDNSDWRPQRPPLFGK